MKTVNAYLTGRAAGNLDPTAAVFVQQHSTGGERWFLECRGDEPVGLGASFREARNALGALIRRRRADERIYRASPSPRPAAAGAAR